MHLKTLILTAAIAFACAFQHVEAARTNVLNGGVTKYTNVTSFIVITTGNVTNDIIQITAKQTTNALLDALLASNGVNLTNLTLANVVGLTASNAALQADINSRISTNQDTEAPHNYTFGGLIITNRIDTRVSTIYGEWKLGVLSNAWLQIDTTGTNLWFIANGITNLVTAVPQ